MQVRVQLQLRLSDVRVWRGGGTGMKGEQERKRREWGRGCHCQGPKMVQKRSSEEHEKGISVQGEMVNVDDPSGGGASLAVHRL